MVKRKIYAVLRFYKVPKTRINKGFSGFLVFYGVSPRARSQSKRATNCATPRNNEIVLHRHLFYMISLAKSSRVCEIGNTHLHKLFTNLLRFGYTRSTFGCYTNPVLGTDTHPSAESPFFHLFSPLFSVTRRPLATAGVLRCGKQRKIRKIDTAISHFRHNFTP